ncbi:MULTISPECIES: chromosome segregation protein SMC [unclassified Acinetobacter]|uniref:chromosome segregation protein SMC n=1 Tax=unclassified Acinetobacter TaxID=196816 RepID=UPI0035B73580
MRLTSLKLVGFKSFAESTTLQFKKNRTAIVGPNGCGKSNVIDAIRWVMGESSAKQLRGGNMQDVIFAGTSQRKAVGVASVELRFDNTYGKLGGAYNAYQELSVKRQVNRDGKSEYFLNGTRCRRKDITDIFLGTGLGPRSYAVIEQGMINRLVDAKPDEMRVFIEEAAGISRYQARRKDTLQHLEHTQDNLSRLHDIRLELQQQSKTLSRQASQAEKYQLLKQQIYQTKLQLLAVDFVQHSQAMQHSTTQLTELSEQHQAQHQHVEQLDIESILLQKNLQEQVAQSEPLQQAWHQARQLHEKILWQLQQQNQQQQDIQEKIALQQLKQQQLLDEQHNDATTQRQLQQQIQDLQQQLAELQPEQVQDLTAWQQQLKQQQQELNTEKEQLAKLQQQATQWQLQQEHLQKNLQRLQQQQQQLQQQQQQANNDELQLQLDDLQLDLASTTLKIEQQQQQCDRLQQALNDNEQQYQHLQQQQQEWQLLQKNLQRDEQQTQKILQQLQQKTGQAQRPLLQQLQLTDAGKQHSQWLEKILAKWLLAETYATENTDFKDGFSQDVQAKNHARQLLLNHQHLPNLPLTAEQQAKFADLKTLSEWIRQPKHSLWQNIYLIENQQQALALQPFLAPHCSMVSLDGFWLGVDWLINLQLDHGDGMDGQLHYQNHLADIVQQLQQLDSQIKQLQPQLQAIGEQRDEQKQQASQTQQQLKNLNQQLQQQQQQQTKWQVQLDAQASQAQQYQQQLQQLSQQYEDDMGELDEIQLDLAQVQLKIEQRQPNVLQQQQQLNQAEQQFEQVQQQQQQADFEKKQLEQMLQKLTAQQQLLQQSEQFKQQQLEQIDEQNIELQQQLEIINAQQQDDEALQYAKQQAEQHEQAWLSWQKQLDALQQQQHDLNQQRSIQQQQENDLRDALENTRLQWQQHKSNASHAAQQLLQVQHQYQREQQQPSENHTTKLQMQLIDNALGKDELLENQQDDNSQAIENTYDLNLESADEELLDDKISLAEFDLNQFNFEQFQQQHLTEIDLNCTAITLAKQQQQLQQAEQQLAKIGAVNLVAYQELQQVDSRLQQLSHQIDDLEQTVEQLKTAMHSIDQETKQLFMKTFDAINQQLTELFPKIFTGGEASLILESDWQSGVKLMARPPGKRNSTLALLSGGEKALTALALVFAIFRLNPAPFCVLDEVDAPLDDANVQRFCHLVTELSEQVQFIYITHNKLAMTMATDLLGVTMPDAGSSKLVQVSLSEAESYL